MGDYHIIASVIAKSQKELEETINTVKDTVEWMQLDVMDGEFVPNTSLNFEMILPSTNCRYEAHLMINNPEIWIKKYHAKVDTILVHIESAENPEEIIKLVKGYNKKIGFALNPKTAINEIIPYLNEIDEVLVMTVEPGYYGSPFVPEALEKVKKFRELSSTIDIEVDGGITDKTIALAKKAGANLFISGSYMVKSNDINGAYQTLKHKLGK